MAWRCALGIDQAITEDHVAPTLAVDQTFVRPQAIQKAGIGGDFAGMEFRIAAGQKNSLGLRVWRLVLKRRKEFYFSTLVAPVLKKVRIDKCEGLIAGHRNGLAQGGEVLTCS